MIKTNEEGTILKIKRLVSLFTALSCCVSLLCSVVSAVNTPTSFDLWAFIVANNSADTAVKKLNMEFLKQPDSAPWCRIVCSNIVLKDIAAKYIAMGVAPPTGYDIAKLTQFLANHTAAATIHEHFVSRLFVGKKAKVHMESFERAPTTDKTSFLTAVDAFFDLAHGHLVDGCTSLNCACLGVGLQEQLKGINREKKLRAFDGLCAATKPSTLTTMWAAIGQNSKKMFLGENDLMVNSEMTQICGVTCTEHSVDPANFGAAVKLIRDEIVNNHRMVILSFKNPVDLNQSHACVAYKASNDVGREILCVYNPWDNWFSLHGANPSQAVPIDSGGAMVWNLYQYTTFDY